jgi:hypothetical protein
MNGMKFRVWLEKSKVMIYSRHAGTPLVLTPWGEMMQLSLNIKTNEYDLIPLDLPYTILFATTYQDKTGTEIYEGDIVKDIIGGDYYLIQFCPTSGFYGVQLPDFITQRGINYLAQRVVVVGNIKENYEEFLHFLKPGVEQ